ncbi:hypothetical protein [Ornithobacterium rhinotracheale]
MKELEINQEQRKDELEVISSSCEVEIEVLEEIFGEDLINMIDL